MKQQNKGSLELRAWLIMAAVALLLIGIGLLLFVLSGTGVAGDYFADLSEVNLWILAGVVAVMALGIVILVRNAGEQPTEKWSINELVVAALCIALAFVLSYIKVYELPNGGSITPASMLPIFVFAYIYGPVKGLLVAFAYSLLQMTQGMYIVHWAQFLLDYVFAFTVLGCAGFFRKQLYTGIIAGGLLRYLCAVLSGFIFFAEYAPAGQAPIIFSLLYNASYMIPELIICVVIALLPGMDRTVKSLKAKELARRTPPQA